MASISNFGIPGTAAGILMPLLENKFRVLFSSSDFGIEDNLELTAQIVSIDTDFKNKQLAFTIEQPATGEVLELLQSLVQRPTAIIIQAMDGGEGVISQMQFTCLETKSHLFSLDYASPSRAASHKVVVGYKHLAIKSSQPALPPGSYQFSDISASTERK